MDDTAVVLARVETKIDTLITSQSDHETRIRRLERAVWSIGGTALIGGGVIGTAAGQVLGG